MTSVVWEYVSVNLPPTAVEQTAKLDEYGRNFWELVAVTVQGYEVRAYFKRPKQDWAAD